ncbi:unnamed protein product, partial [Iphiclides podalirius]
MKTNATSVRGGVRRRKVGVVASTFELHTALHWCGTVARNEARAERRHCKRHINVYDVPSYTTFTARADAVYVTASRSRLTTVRGASERRPRAAACTSPRPAYYRRALPAPARAGPNALPRARRTSGESRTRIKLSLRK